MKSLSLSLYERERFGKFKSYEVNMHHTPARGEEIYILFFMLLLFAEPVHGEPFSL